MKNSLKRYIIRNFPPVIWHSMYYLKVWLKKIKIKSLLRENLKLKNKYDGESVYVIGNGPSLNNYDLQKIKNMHVITMNYFELHPLKNDFHVVAHCIGESYKAETWADPSGSLNGVNAETFWFNADAFSYFGNKKRNKIHYYLPGVLPSVPFITGSDISKVALNYESTSQMAINIALYLGFKKIYLLGLDHDWLVTRGHSPHFYEEQDGIDKTDFSKFSYLEMIEKTKNLFEMYYKLRENSERSSAKIWNLSKPSYLDVFLRLD
jgi:hypothetical protein